MSTSTEIQALRTELEQVKQELDHLKQALNLFINDAFSIDQRAAWRRAKSGDHTPTDATVGKGLPAPAVKVTLNGIGADVHLR